MTLLSGLGMASGRAPLVSRDDLAQFNLHFGLKNGLLVGPNLNPSLSQVLWVGIRRRIKRLGLSPCVLFLCSFLVEDDALTSCPTGRPAAVPYRLWSVSLPCQQPPIG